MLHRIYIDNICSKGYTWGYTCSIEDIVQKMQYKSIELQNEKYSKSTIEENENLSVLIIYLKRFNATVSWRLKFI